MGEHRIAHRKRTAGGSGVIQRLQHVDAGVELRMMRHRLRHAEQCIDFGQQ